MKKHLKRFVKEFTNAIQEDTAAIFAGAGLSIPSGYVNWKELLREIAEELDLDIDKETDLISLAQYYVNEKRSRASLNKKIITEFKKKGRLNPNHRELAKFPIKTFWTTNYDTLIETSLTEIGKNVDIKITKENLAESTPGTDAIVYKMHGDISMASDAVLIKDDYENYNVKRQLFTTALQGDLISKTFLFIGFSFDDPNLEYILSRIKILLGENQRDHYCFLKNPQLEDFKKLGLSKERIEEEFIYAKVKQEYKIKDLKRYSINVLLIDDYKEITEVLSEINKRLRLSTIFISGAAADYGAFGEKKALDFVYKLAKKLIDKDLKLVSGFGAGIGSTILNGVLSYAHENNIKNIDKLIKLRPFPQLDSDGAGSKEAWHDYRKKMISETGISIFIFGNKKVEDTIKESDGMLEEFELTKANHGYSIPVGITGDVSKKIWNQVVQDKEYLKDNPNALELIKELADTIENDEILIEKIIKIIEHIHR